MYGHGWIQTSLGNKMHGLSWRRRACHISLTQHWAEQVWWSHTFWALLCFNLKDFHYSTQVINHAAAQAAWRQDAETATYTNILNHRHTLKGTIVHFGTTGHTTLYVQPFSIHALPTEFFLMHMCTHLQGIFHNQGDQMASNKSNNEAFFIQLLSKAKNRPFADKEQRSQWCLTASHHFVTEHEIEGGGLQRKSFTQISKTKKEKKKMHWI